MRKNPLARIRKLVSRVKEHSGSTSLYAKNPRHPEGYARKARAYNLRENRRVARIKHPGLKGIALAKKGNMMR